jgi:hypothetical protein
MQSPAVSVYRLQFKQDTVVVPVLVRTPRRSETARPVSSSRGHKAERFGCGKSVIDSFATLLSVQQLTAVDNQQALNAHLWTTRTRPYTQSVCASLMLLVLALHLAHMSSDFRRHHQCRQQTSSIVASVQLRNLLYDRIEVMRSFVFSQVRCSNWHLPKTDADQSAHAISNRHTLLRLPAHQMYNLQLEH